MKINIDALSMIGLVTEGGGGGGGEEGGEKQLQGRHPMGPTMINQYTAQQWSGTIPMKSHFINVTDAVFCESHP